METSTSVPGVTTLATREGPRGLPLLDAADLPPHLRASPSWPLYIALGGAAGLALVFGVLAAAVGFAPWVGAALPVLPIGGVLARVLLKHRAFVRANTVGLHHLKSSSPDTAAEIYESLAEQSEYKQRSAALLNLALAEISRGHLERAGALLSEVSTTGDFALQTSIQLATVYGLMNEIDAARAWIDEFDRLRASPGAGHRRYLKCLAEVIVALRSGALEQALIELERHGKAIASVLDTVYPGVTQAIWASALAAADRREDKRFRALSAELDAIDDAQQLKRAFERWPEVRAFLDEREQAPP